MKQNCITDSLSFSGTGWLGKDRSATKNLRRMSLRPCARIACAIASFSFAASAMCDVIHITESSSSGYTMTDGNTYVVDNSVSFSNETVGGSGITIADNATVVVFVPADVTLTATGANGSGQIGGGAGIRVPETATLIITGEGCVNSVGGNAGNGEDGCDGGVGYVGTIEENGITYFAPTCRGGVAAPEELAVAALVLP